MEIGMQKVLDSDSMYISSGFSNVIHSMMVYDYANFVHRMHIRQTRETP
jgi:hypothetical protein